MGIISVRVLGAVAASGAAVFLGALVSLHLLRSDLSPLDDYVSDYANGRHGLLFTGTGIVHGTGNLALTVGLAYTVRGARLGRWGVALFGVSSLGLLVGAVFPTDPPTAAATTVGLVHRAAAYVSFPVELLALMMFARVFADRMGWRRHADWTRVVCLFAATSLGWLVVALVAGWPPGLAERAALGGFLMWELGTGVRLLVNPMRAPASHPPRGPEISPPR